MKKLLPFLFFLSLPPLFAQSLFDDHFLPSTLRIDYIFAGNDSSTNVYFLGMKHEPYWGGTRTRMTTPFPYGEFHLGLYDAESGECIYSQGFSTLFSEWQTTAEARLLNRAYYQSSVMPYPKNKCDFRISRRQRDGSYNMIFSMAVDPSDYFILEEDPVSCPVSQLIYHGDPAEKVDLVFLAEGYMAGEMEKFRKDAARMAEALFNTSPFREYHDRFNIWLAESPSGDSGPDVPGQEVYRRTCFSSHYYTFDIDRYLTTWDFLRMRDYAANVPYDHMVLLINSNQYGGGGIYNHYTISTVDHALSGQVWVHELGHGFAGLGDEYYSSEVAYENFYPLDVEPWEPNLTTLVDFGSKWEDMVNKKTPIPTPPLEKYFDRVGVFEGGGYSARGVYRPSIDCLMKSNEKGIFCPVCERAVIKMIEYYSE